MKSKGNNRYYKDDVILKSIGAKIRKIRLSKNISIEMLANDCELDSSQIGRMELGKVNFSISALYRVARALKVDPKEFL